MWNRRRWPLLLLVLLWTLPLGGCWDRRELEETAFVLAMGLDPGQSPDEVHMTAMIAIPSKMAEGGQGGGGEEDRVMVTTAVASTLGEGLNLMDTYLDRRISLEHAKALIINRQLAGSKTLPRLLDALGRHRPVRRTMPVLVAEGSAETLLAKAQPVLEREPHRYLEFLPATTRDTGLSPREADLHELLTFTENPGIDPVAYRVSLREQPGGLNQEGAGKEGARPGAAGQGGEPGGGGSGGSSGSGGGGADGAGGAADAGQPTTPLPGPRQPEEWEPGQIPRRGGPNLEMVGAAVFRSGRMVGTMTGQEVRTLNLLRGRFRRAFLSLDDPLAPGYQVGVEVRSAQTARFQASRQGGRIAVSALFPLEVEVQEVKSGIDYSEPQRQDVLAQAIAQRFEANLQEFIRKSQQEWRADVAGFGLKAARLFPTYQEWVAYNWEERYPEVQIQVAVDVNIRRFGMNLAPPDPQPGRE